VGGRCRQRQVKTWAEAGGKREGTCYLLNMVATDHASCRSMGGAEGQAERKEDMLEEDREPEGGDKDEGGRAGRAGGACACHS